MMGDMDREEFRRQGHRLEDWIADYLEEQNASTNDKIFTRWPTATTPFNDQTVTIP